MPEHQMRNKGELLANKTTRCKYHGIFMQKDVCVTSTPHNFIFSLISGKSAVNLFGEYVHVEVPCTPQDLQNLIMFLRTLHTYTTCPVHHFLKASVASNKNINTFSGK